MMQVPSDSDSWSFTIIRSQGLGPLRPEKSWRPIVTLVFDQQHHELVLGSDGQNPNLKKSFYLRHVDPKSPVDIHIWHKSQSKKKGRKRNQVASARHSLVDLLKKQGTETSCEVHLNCFSSKETRSSRGKQPNGAYLYVKLRPPASFTSLSESLMELDVGPSAISDHSSSGSASDTITPPSTPLSIDFVSSEASGVIAQQKPKHRSVRGYSIDTDDEGNSYSVDSDSDDYRFIEEDFSIEALADSECVGNVVEVPPTSAEPWLAASVLPRYVDQMSVGSTMSVAESTLSCITSYRELKDASLDTDFEKIRSSLQFEWCFVGGTHVALAGLAAAVFGFSPGSMFAVSDTFAKNAVAVAGVSSAFGLSVTAWLLLRHGGSDIARFQQTALDVYQTYFFFSITSRIPAFCLLVSAVALLGFMFQVSYGAWPTATIIMSFIGGILCGLQYVVWALHTIGIFIFRVLRTIKNGIERVYTQATGTSMTHPPTSDVPSVSPPSLPPVAHSPGRF